MAYSKEIHWFDRYRGKRFWTNVYFTSLTEWNWPVLRFWLFEHMPNRVSWYVRDMQTYMFVFCMLQGARVGGLGLAYVGLSRLATDLECSMLDVSLLQVWQSAQDNPVPWAAGVLALYIPKFKSITYRLSQRKYG
jgi:hypothetical protein